MVLGRDAILEAFRGWDTLSVPLAVTASACGEDKQTVHTRLRRSIPQGSPELGTVTWTSPKTVGHPVLLTLRTHFAVVAAGPLIRGGVEVFAAYQACRAWTHFAEGPVGTLRPAREPGQLFPEPFYTMLIYPGRTEAGAQSSGLGEVVAVAPDFKFQMTDLFPDGVHQRIAPQIVWLNAADRFARMACQRYLENSGRIPS